VSDSSTPDEPQISFAVASYNSRAYLGEAVSSALAQEDVRCEVLIVDDGSSDGSVELAQSLAAADRRVRLLTTSGNGGPAAARNVALAAMRGHWFAVLDSDDVLLPGRSRSLLALAQTERADMMADDLEVFSRNEPHGKSFLGSCFRQIASLELRCYFEHSRIYGDKPNFGFLKPMIRRSFLDKHGLRYDETLRIGEDDRLAVACLLAGARYSISGDAGYRYRKHEASISHRLAPQDADAMVAANRAIGVQVRGCDAATRRAFAARAASYRDAAAFAHAIGALQRGQLVRGMSQVLGRPSAIPLFMMPIRSRLSRIRKADMR